MKTIVLMVSKAFPCYHPRKGELTNFKDKILSGEKIHTIRGNYDLWKKRIDQVNAGTHKLVLKSWVGRPYYTSQEIVATFDKDSGLGVQKTTLYETCCSFENTFKTSFDALLTISKNDGLEYGDFWSWFDNKKYDLSKPMAIIHLTGFRY